MAGTDVSHWLTRWDTDTGEPYGQVCQCAIGQDHDGSSQLADELSELLTSEHGPVPEEYLDEARTAWPDGE